jgi:hypothetical protein
VSADTPSAEQVDWVERLDQLHLLTPLRVLAIVLVAAIVSRCALHWSAWCGPSQW